MTDSTQLPVETKEKEAKKEEEQDDVLFSQPSLPFLTDFTGGAMIQNPTKPNEILMFQADNLELVHIYNTQTKTFTTNEKTDFDLCLSKCKSKNNTNPTRSPIAPLFCLKLIVDINNNDRLITFAHSVQVLQSHAEPVGFFGIFNTKLLKWQFVDIDEKIYGKFHYGKVKTVCYKNFLIITGGDKSCNDRISLFDLNSIQLNENNIQLIGKFNIPKVYSNHGMIRVKYYHSDVQLIKHHYESKKQNKENKENKENEVNEDKYDKVTNISLLLFGGRHNKFQDSFSHVSIKIGEHNNGNNYINNNDDDDVQGDTCVQQVNQVDSKYKIIGYTFLDGKKACSQDLATSHIAHLLKSCVNTLSTMEVDVNAAMDAVRAMSGVNYNDEIAKRIRFKNKHLLDYHWHEFDAFLIDDRYLVILGGKFSREDTANRWRFGARGRSNPYTLLFDGRMTHILYFDMENYNCGDDDDDDNSNYKNWVMKWKMTKYNLKGEKKADSAQIPEQFKKNLDANSPSVFLVTQNCILFKNPRKCIYFMSNDVTGRLCPNWKIKIDRRIEWNIERIIWIAFYQNKDNKKCLIQLLPKDIVKKILALLVSPSLIFL